jgi:MGT family glycosyltransferase
VPIFCGEMTVKMSRVLFLGFPAFGHINFTLGLIKELSDRGETVEYFLSDEYKDILTGTGAKFNCYNGAFLEKNQEKSDKDQLEQIKRQENLRNELTGKNAFSMLYDLAVSRLNESLRILQLSEGLFLSNKPDYIIHDSFALWGKIFAKRTGIPAISSITNHAIGRRILEYDSLAVVKAAVGNNNMNVFKDYSHDMLCRLIELATNRIVKLTGINDFEFLDMVTATEELNIIYSSNKFQLSPKSFDESYAFVGPCFFPREAQKTFRYDLLDGRPLIYISLGTIFNDNISVYKKCINAFKETGYQVVMSIGNKIDEASLGSIPENFIIVRSAPQLEILKKACLFITHGGANSIMEGAWTGVPFIVIPQAFDQSFGAETVQSFNIGINMPGDDFEVGELKASAEKILSQDKYRENVKEVGEWLREAGGAKKAVDRIFLFKEAHGIK